MSLRVIDTERPDVWEVQGRGELALAVLVELMRREGYELTVGKPQVVTREIDGRQCEPVERMSVDAPEEYVGVITQLLAMRKGRLEQMVNHGTGWVRMEYLVPARGLIGFRTEFLTETRGTGLVHHVFDRWEPWHGELRTRPSGSLVADRRGTVAAFALFNLQERGTLFVAPGDEVYEGLIVGENSRAEDLDVNATKEKHLTNIRSSTADELVRLVPKRELSLDQALEFLRADECVEVTPHAVRLRKVGARRDRAAQADPGGEGVSAQVLAQLSVRRGREAVEFYKQAFGAVEVYRVGGSDSNRGRGVATRGRRRSSFWVADESPEHLNFSPETVGGGTVRLLLIVDDPDAAIERAVAAGATIVRPAADEHGWRLGRIADPFGHHWEVGKPLRPWPPAH